MVMACLLLILRLILVLCYVDDAVVGWALLGLWTQILCCCELAICVRFVLSRLVVYFVGVFVCYVVGLWCILFGFYIWVSSE